MSLKTGPPSIINFSFGANEILMILGVPITPRQTRVNALRQLLRLKTQKNKTGSTLKGKQ